MIRGLGCDVCAVERMQKILENPRFLERWFTAEERAYIGARKNAAETAKKYGLPIICSMSFEKSGRTMMGNRVEDVVETLAPLGIDAIGLNCSLGPEQAVPIIRSFREFTDLPLFFKPNAGMPVAGQLTGNETPEQFADAAAPVLELIRYIGGCCGTNPDFIREIGKRMGR